MRIDQLTDILSTYRQDSARITWLRGQAEMLNRFLTGAEARAVSESISMSQAITGMPHGSNPGDPVGRLAIDLASGKAAPFVDDIKRDLEEVQSELAAKQWRVEIADTAMAAMSAKGADVVRMKIVDELSWAEIIFKIEQLYNSKTSKRTLQRLLAESIERGVEAVR